jgi:hypothetical protein
MPVGLHTITIQNIAHDENTGALLGCHALVSAAPEQAVRRVQFGKCIRTSSRKIRVLRRSTSLFFNDHLPNKVSGGSNLELAAFSFGRALLED